MGPVRQNPIQRTVSLFICVCITLCTIVAHNIAQNRPDSFPPYPQQKELTQFAAGSDGDQPTNVTGTQPTLGRLCFSQSQRRLDSA